MKPLRILLTAALFALGLIQTSFAQAPPAVPGLPDTERRTSYTISASTCACAVNFALYGDSTDYGNWLEVYVNGVLQNAGTYTITSPTGQLATIPRPITDAILTFNANVTGTVQIVGARRPRRVSQFTEGRGVPARDLNQALTDIIAQNRESWDKINDVSGRGLFSQPGNTVGQLPLPSQCASSYLTFDSTGLNPVCVPSTPFNFPSSWPQYFLSTFCTPTQLATDATTCINTAETTINGFGGGTLIFPVGTILGTPTKLPLVYWRGQGRGVTIIKQPNSKNVTYGVVTGTNWASLVGTNTYANGTGVYDAGISDLTIDGNKANNTTGDCLDIFGYRYTLTNFAVQNCPVNGIRSEFGQYGTMHMQANWNDVIVQDTGQIGVLYKGPHDSSFRQVIVKDAGESTNNTYDGIKVDGYGSFRGFDVHYWNTGIPANIALHALELTANSYVTTLTGSDFEGSYGTVCVIAGQENYIDSSSSCFYGVGSGYLVSITGNNNVVNANLTVVGGAITSGIQLVGAGNIITASILGATSGNIDFTGDTGYNTVTINGSQATGPGYVGTPAGTDNITFSAYGATSNAFFNQQYGTGTVYAYQNSVATAQISNANAGASAGAQYYASSNAGAIAIGANSTAGGANAFINNTTGKSITVLGPGLAPNAVLLNKYTIGTLPTCNSSYGGLTAYLADTVAAAPAWHGNVTAGATAYTGLVSCNGGSNWIYE